MSFSATRLTCYALLSALEEDLRRHINQNIGHLPPDEVFTGDEVEKTRARRRGDGGAVDSFSAEALLPYLDFADSHQILRRHASCLPESLVEALSFVTKRLDKLVSARNRVAHTRPMDMDDLPNLLDLCDELVPGDNSALWEHLAETLNRIKEEPSFVLGMKIDLPKDPDTAPWHNLPVPDYDETGFFGRREQIKRIKKIIKGPYPVVSILGDGGIGKTSIALKVAYDLLDDADSPFEAVVWVTAKATILTTNEIKRINDAIEDSLGLFAKAAEMFGPGGGTDPIREVLEYLEHFRVLLILDNLETVLDTKLREFLLELPVGSKVVLTSRIGAGVENPVSLDPLTDDESSRLMHALARIRDVKAINSLPSQDRLQLAKAMGGRPAYIRWFVAGVQSGRRPEELLKDNDLFLDFCMSNVYEYLSEDAREVIRCMQVLPGALSPAAIAFLTDFSASRTQSTLLELLTTNFVHMSTRSRNTSVESAYELTDFGKQYLGRPIASAR